MVTQIIPSNKPCYVYLVTSKPIKNKPKTYRYACACRWVQAWAMTDKGEIQPLYVEPTGITIPPANEVYMLGEDKDDLSVKRKAIAAAKKKNAA